jgi:Na+/proline symporter
MDIDTTWVWVFLALYVVYCFYWGLRGYFTEKTSYGYSIGGRQIPMIAFLMAATAASFSGWTTVGHPGLIWKYGLAYAFASFYVLTIPITGSFFAKRTWLMGKRYGFVTPGDMYAYYYNNENVRWLVVLTAILYGVFYSAVQLIAAGALFHWVTGFPLSWGAILMAFIVWFYVVTGGLRASTWVGVIQFILLVFSIILIGIYVLIHFGGWTALSQQVAGLPESYLKVPSIIEFTVGEQIWTSVMILTYLFALMGIQSSPAFTMWQFANKNPKPFAWQQVFMSTFVVGFALLFFTAFQGLGGQILDMQGLIEPVSDRDVVPMLMAKFLPPFVLGICFIGIIAAMHSTAAPYIGTAGSMLLRDVWWLKIRRKKGGHAEQIWFNRLFVTILTIFALLVGLHSTAAIVILGALATALGFVMYVPLLGTLWGFRWPSIGTFLGILVGLAVVFLTYHVFPNPLTIHSAAWGTGSGLIVAYLCRFLGAKDSQETIDRQMEVRSWLDNIEQPSPSGRSWRNSMKIVVPLWYLFAVGPLCILGNYGLFSFAGFPSLWSWQIAWWMIGIVMMWALCFKAEMATITDEQIRRAETESKIVVEEVT